MNDDWIKLDNAALIYPATISRKYASLFRLSVTLTEDIDKEILKDALNITLKRFPTFNYSLKQGFFWFYLQKINIQPIIDTDAQNPLVRKNFDKRYLFRIRVNKNRLAIEYFHALTDGTGGITFLLTLTSVYLKLKYNIKIHYSSLILNTNEVPTEDETSDSFLKFVKNIGSLEHENKAYHIKGVNEKANILNIVTGIININKLKTISNKYNATITEFLASLLLYSIKQMAYTRKEIKVSIPINLRNIYETKTLRNFSSYVNVGIKGNKDYTLEEIINEVKYQLKYLTDEKRINAKFSANVKLMKNFFIRRIPLFIKKRIMSFIEYNMGDGYITTTLSNLGLIKIDKNMEKYITDMNFILGKSRGKSNAVTSIGYKNNIYITFSRTIIESDLERIFFTNLSKMGIHIKIESNR